VVSCSLRRPYSWIRKVLRSCLQALNHRRVLTVERRIPLSLMINMTTMMFFTLESQAARRVRSLSIASWRQAGAPLRLLKRARQYMTRACSYRIERATRKVNSYMSLIVCKLAKCRWSQGRVVFSCVSIRVENGIPQILPPLNTAMNITAVGVSLLGISFFGCSDTAVEVHGSDIYFSVRSPSRRWRQAQGSIL
jgi:hypothetical protein